jgi:CBS domain-containing protein
MAAIQAVPAHLRENMAAGAIMTPLSVLPQVAADVDGWTLLRQMTDAQVSEACVLEGDRPMGIITLRSLLNYAQLSTSLA